MFSSDKRHAKTSSPSSLETLADRIDTLAHAVSSTAATLAKKDGELVATRRALEARMGDLETYVTNTLQEFRSAASAATVSPRAEKRERIDGEVVLLGEAVNTLTTQFESLASRFEATSGQVDVHDRDLKSLATRAKDSSRLVTSPPDSRLEAQVRDVAQELAATAERIEAQQERIASLETAVPGSIDEALQERIEELDLELVERVQSVAEGLASTAERIEAQQERIASLETAAPVSSDEALQQRIEELDRQLEEKVQSVSEGLAATAERIEAQQERIASLESAGPSTSAGPRKRAQDRAAERQVRGVAEGLAAVAERLDAQQEELASLTSELAAADGVVQRRIDELDSALTHQVQDVVGGLTAAAARIDVQQDEIVSLASALATSGDGLQQRVEELDGAFAQQVQDVLQGLTAAAERLEAQQERIASLEAAHGVSDDGLQQRVEEFDRAVAQQVQEVVEGLTAAVEQIGVQQERLTSLEAAQAVPDSGLLRVEELEETFRAYVAEHQAIEPGVPADVEARLAELGTFTIGLRDTVDDIDARVNALGADVESALVEPSIAPAELERQFAEAGARFDAIVSDLRNLAHMLSTSTTNDHDELGSRLDAMRDSMAAALERIELLETDVETTSDVSAPRVEHLEHELAALRAKLRHTTSSDELSSHLDSLRLELSKTMTRLERAEDLSTRTAYNTTSSMTRLTSAVDELRTKVDQVERLEDGLLAKLDRAQALWPVALRALEGRIEDLATAREHTRTDEESLLSALHEGIATAHSVIGDSDGAGDHIHENGGQNGDVEPPPTRSARRTPAKSRRST